ncbi:MAG: methyltransferase domain-containing protein [Myxococcota bacterium]
MACQRARDVSAAFTPDGRLLLRAPMRGVAVRAPPFAAELLAFCSEPREASEVERSYGPQARQLFERLVAAGLLCEPEQALETPVFFANFASLDTHRRMLADGPRMEAYARAIAATVRPGMVVLDAGTGSGILAAQAALAGARTVYAVDNSDALDLAVEVFAASGVADRVRPVRGDFRNVALSEKVDVIITETFGAFGLAEDGMSDIAECATRNLAPGGVVLPRALDLWLAPTSDRAALDEAVGPFASFRGVVLSPLQQAGWGRGITRELRADALIAEPQRILHAALGQDSPAGTAAIFEVADAEFVGWCGWFDLDMGDFVFSTGPSAPMTHWKQQYLPSPALRAPGSWTVEVGLAAPPDDRRGLEVSCAWTAGGASRRTCHRLR